MHGGGPAMTVLIPRGHRGMRPRGGAENGVVVVEATDGTAGRGRRRSHVRARRRGFILAALLPFLRTLFRRTVVGGKQCRRGEKDEGGTESALQVRRQK